MIRTFLRLSLSIFASLLASLLLVTLASAQDSTVELNTPIALETDATQDAAIAERLTTLFAQLNGLDGVRPTVTQGVVTLSGETANEAQAEQALRTARRLTGIVAVQDEITRTLDVTENVSRVNETVAEALAQFTKALPLIVVGLLAWLLLGLLGRFLGTRVTNEKRSWISRKLGERKLNPFLANVLSQIIKVIFFLAGMVVFLNLVGASGLVTTILGGAGVLGIALGFAIRDTLENYISSILLSLRQPFRAGDHIVINATHEGHVARLTSRATILVTPDGNHLRIPNADVFKGTILNYTTNPTRRLDFTLGVDSADDPVAAIETGTIAMAAFDFILEDPAPTATITEVGDSSILIRYFAWVNQTETNFGKARSLVIQSVKDVLETSGFSLPEPLYRLKIDGLDVSAKVKAAAKRSNSKPPKKPSAPTSASATDVTPDVAVEETLQAEAAKSNLLSDSANPE